jgi:hypothetical protein
MEGGLDVELVYSDLFQSESWWVEQPVEESQRLERQLVHRLCWHQQRQAVRLSQRVRTGARCGYPHHERVCSGEAAFAGYLPAHPPLREGGTRGEEQLQGCTYKLIKLFDLCVRRPRREEGRERLADGCSSVATECREEEAQQEITPEQAARPGIVVSQHKQNIDTGVQQRTCWRVGCRLAPPSPSFAAPPPTPVTQPPRSFRSPSSISFVPQLRPTFLAPSQHFSHSRGRMSGFALLR